MRKFLFVSSVILSFNAYGQTEPSMVEIPAACVNIGVMLLGENSNLLREVCLELFQISQYEITFQQFDEFILSTARAPRHDLGFGREKRPLVDVNWFDANDYANWISQMTGKHYRLPSDAEWEYAAKANAQPGQKYSWGGDPAENNANCRNCGSQWDAEMTAPVGSFTPNAFGLFDMHGNVWEWTSNCFVANSPTVVRDRHCQSGVVRGGSWDTSLDSLVFYNRAAYLSENTSSDIGFRSVLQP